MTQNETLSVGDNAHSPRGGGHINNPTTNIHGKNLIIMRFKAFIYHEINLSMIFHREISLFTVLGENGDARNQNNLDVKSSPPGTPESKSSSSTGEGGQATGCGQTGSSSGGGGVCGGNKMMAIRVQMLDDSITLFQVQVRKRMI